MRENNKYRIAGGMFTPITGYVSEEIARNSILYWTHPRPDIISNLIVGGIDAFGALTAYMTAEYVGTVVTGRPFPIRNYFGKRLGPVAKDVAHTIKKFLRFDCQHATESTIPSLGLEQ